MYGLLAVALGVGSWQALRIAGHRDEPDVIFAPTPQPAIDAMLELAGVTKNDVVYDLGCGDARILVTAAKKYGCRAVGVEMQPHLVEAARRNAEAAGVSHLVEIREGDLFEADFHDATVVAVFLLPDLNAKLVPKLNKLPPGSRIVSYQFAIEGVPPTKHISVPIKDGDPRSVYLWTVPLEPADPGS